MTLGSLFAGIGGIDLGFERAGFKTVWQVEINPYCRKVLERHFPDAERFEDVRTVGRHNLKPVDVIAGGFPCQDISNAGKRAGIDGERSGLWSEYARIIGELRPRFVLVENVAALLGRGMGRVLGDLAEIGYDAEWEVVSAADVGAPHLRERVWLVAYPASIGLEGVKFQWQRLMQFSWTGNKSPSILDAANDSEDGDGIRRHYTTREWGPEPNVGRVVDGLSLELDFSRQITGWCHEQRGNKETKPERNELVWKLLRAVWEHRELAEASPDLYVQRLRDSVPSVPLHDSQSRWKLGAWVEENQGLRDLWQAFYSQPFEEAQDMQFKLLERAWSEKRKQTVGSRVDRLRGLGNAVVPQIPELIANRIRECLEAA